MNTSGAPVQLATGTIFVIERVATRFLEHWVDGEVEKSHYAEIVDDKEFRQSRSDSSPEESTPNP
eukprot:6187942-Prymnesium_polylepis.2